MDESLESYPEVANRIGWCTECGYQGPYEDFTAEYNEVLKMYTHRFCPKCSNTTQDFPSYDKTKHDWLYVPLLLSSRLSGVEVVGLGIAAYLTIFGVVRLGQWLL